MCSGITKSPSVGSISEELSLNTFVSKYGKSLPHKVKVCKGFYGVSDQTAVTTGDILNLHFLKSTKVSGRFRSSTNKLSKLILLFCFSF